MINVNLARAHKALEDALLLLNEAYLFIDMEVDPETPQAAVLVRIEFIERAVRTQALYVKTLGDVTPAGAAAWAEQLNLKSVPKGDMAA